MIGAPDTGAPAAAHVVATATALPPLHLLRQLDGWLLNTGYQDGHPWRVAIARTLAAFGPPRLEDAPRPPDGGPELLDLDSVPADGPRVRSPLRMLLDASGWMARQGLPDSHPMRQGLAATLERYGHGDDAAAQVHETSHGVSDLGSVLRALGARVSELQEADEVQDDAAAELHRLANFAARCADDLSRTLLDLAECPAGSFYVGGAL